MTVVQTPTNHRNRMHWGRIVGLAFALEAALVATLVPIQSLISRRVWFAAVAIGCALFGYIAGRLASKGLSSQRVLHGLLVGVIATIIYIVLCMVGPGGLAAAVALYGAPLYVSLNALRIASCVVGASSSEVAKTVERHTQTL